LGDGVEVAVVRSSAMFTVTMSTATMSTSMTPAGRKRHRSGLRYWRCTE
jgi:hypothetical protein